MRTAAVISRWNLIATRRLERRRRRDLAPPSLLLGDAAVPALALLELRDRLEEVAGPEVGPEDGRHVDLGVRDLPEEVVRDAHLAARPDEEVRVGQPGRVELGFDRGLVDVLGPQAAGLHFVARARIASASSARPE